MSLSLACLDLTPLFCDVDDFYREFERFGEGDLPGLPDDKPVKGDQSKLSISEVMTIMIGHWSVKRRYIETLSCKGFPELIRV
jgi:hypothetical protein